MKSTGLRKVQSALLEAMAERQVSVGQRTMKLDRLFLVMATQNPIEQEGTYPFARGLSWIAFFMHVKIDYPDAEAERQISNSRAKRTQSSAERGQRARHDHLRPFSTQEEVGGP